MAKLIKTKFKYISKKTIAIFMAIVVVSGYAVWQIGNLTFNADATNFVDAANSNHWGRSDLRAFLNPTLADEKGNKNYLVNSTAGGAPTGEANANSYEQYFKNADLEILRSGIGYTVETKNSATNVMEETTDRFWFPSGKDDKGNLYWGKEDISDESTKIFVENDMVTGTGSKGNYFIPADKVTTGSWLRSSTGNDQANTTNGTNSVSSTAGVAPVFTISKESFYFASIARASDIHGYKAVGNYKDQDSQAAMYLKKQDSNTPMLYDVKVYPDEITFDVDVYDDYRDYHVVVCIYDEEEAHLYSADYLDDRVTRRDNLENFDVVAWVEKESERDTTVNQVGQIYEANYESGKELGSYTERFDVRHQLFAEKNDLHASWKLDRFESSGAGQKIYLGIDKSGNPIPFWICGEFGTFNGNTQLVENGDYLVLYQATSNTQEMNYNGENEYNAGEGGKGNIPTVTISDKDEDDHYTSYVDNATPNDILTYTNGLGETPTYTWYNYKLEEGSDTSTTATSWTPGFPQQLGKYKVKASAGQTNSNATVESQVVTVEVVPKLIGITVKNSQNSYVNGQDFKLDTLTVIAEFSDGSTKPAGGEDVTITIKDPDGNDFNYTYAPFESNGDYTVTVTYTQKTDAGDVSVSKNVTITVTDKKLIRMEASAVSLRCIEGMELDTTNITVKAYYDLDPNEAVIIYRDGAMTAAGIGNLEFSPTKFVYSEESETQYLTVKYSESGVDTVAVLPVIVEKKKVESIAVVSNPSKMEYIRGEEFNSAGLIVKAVYNNGDERLLGHDEYAYPTTTFNDVSTTTVTITYTGTDFAGSSAPSTDIRGIKVNYPQVIGIEVNTENWNNSYISGQEFRTDGLVVEAVYNNGTRVTLNPKSDSNQDGYEYPKNVILGVEQCAIIYTTMNPVNHENETFIAMVNVNVTSESFASIEVLEDPTNKNYVVGQSFDPTGLVIGAKLTSDSDGQPIRINSFNPNLWAFEPDVFDTPTTEDALASVKVTYKPVLSGEQSVSTDITGITVVPKQVTGISVVGQPTQIHYADSSQFKPDGLIIQATYNDGEIKTVQYSSDTSKFAFDTQTLEFGDALQKDINVTYTDGEYGSASTTVTVYKVRKMVSELEIKDSYDVKKNYIEGQTFDPSNLAVTVYYTDGTSKLLEVKKTYVTDETTGEKKEVINIPDGLSFRPDGKLTTADTEVTISYTEGGPIVEATIRNIIVEPKRLAKIAFAEDSEDAVKKDYIEGQTFDPTGLIVMGIYDGGDVEKLECKNGILGGGIGYTYSPEGGLTTSNKSITISATVSGVETLSIPITVESRKPTEIKISRYPQKMEYIEGQTFDPTGLEVAVIYNDGNTKKVEVTNAASLPEGLIITSADPLQSGNQKVTVTYEEAGVQKVTTLSISVRGKQVIGIEVNDANLQKKHYVVGEEFNSTGLVVYKVYDNGTKDEMGEKSNTNTDGYYYNSRNLTLGVKQFPIFYDIISGAGTETVFGFVGVEVTHRSFSKIEVSSESQHKTEYIEGQPFDPTGLVITATLSAPITPDGDGTEITSVTIKNFNDGFWEFTPDPLETSTTSVNVAYKFGSEPKTAINGITVNKKELTSISVKNLPNNIRYAAGAEFKPEGLIITANYNDGTSKTVEYSNTMSGIIWDPRTLEFKDGDSDVTSQTVNITYTEDGISKSANITVYKVPNVPSKLEILDASGNETDYTEGEEFDPVGLRLKVTYTDGKEKEITIASKKDLETNNVSYSPTGPLSASTTEMTIEYTEPDRTADGNEIGELTVKSTQAITVTARTLDRIEITTLPKVSYVEGEKFDPTGMVITRYYDNGTLDTTTDYTLTYEDGTPVEGELFLEDGRATKRTIKVTLNNAQDKTANFDIWIAVKIPTELTINHDPKTNYVIGQSFDPTGLELTVTYNNGISETIAVTDKNNLAPGLSFVVTDPLTSNTDKVVIKFEKNGERIETELKITVEEKKVDYIYVANRPEKILYIEGETFNPAGMVVKSHYNDGEEIELKSSDYTYSTEPLQWNGAAEQDIEITYKEDSTKTAHQTVTVIQKTITGLEIKKGPDNTAYFVGESFDPTGMQINAIFNNGEIIPVYGEGAEDIGGELIITPSTLSYGDTRVMVSYIYNGIAVVTKQDVTVSVRLLDSISIINPPKNLEYVEEESFDPEEMVIMAKYNNGFEEQIDNSNLVISPNPLTIDTKSVSIYYTSGNITKVATQEILVRSIDEVYKRATLQDELKQALITGKFTEGAELVITRIEDDYELYTELYERLTEKSDVALLYDVSIVGGEYHGKLRLTFVVGETFNGREITIIHKLASGEKEFLSGIVKNGRVTVTVNELSPFMLALDTEEDNNGGSSSGDNNGGNSNSGNNTNGSNNNDGSGSGSVGDGSGSGSNGDGSNVLTGSNILNTGDNSLAVVLGLIVTISVCAVVILILRKSKSNK